MLFFLRFSSSAMLEMSPSQRFWMTWSMVAFEKVGSYVTRRDLHADSGNGCSTSSTMDKSITSHWGRFRRLCPKSEKGFPLFSFASLGVSPSGHSFVPELAFSEPCLKFSPARHPSTVTPPPLPPTVLAYHHGSDTPPLKTHV